jgi:hypothetical protein
MIKAMATTGKHHLKGLSLIRRITGNTKTVNRKARYMHALAAIAAQAMIKT